MNSFYLHKQSTMQLFIFTLLVGVCYCVPSDFLDAGNDRFNPIGEASSLNNEVQSNEVIEQPKYSCSIFDSILTRNCTDEAEYYLDDARKTCCTLIVVNSCKIRLLKQVCTDEEYSKKVLSLEQNSNFAWDETPDCPKNYGKSYCEISTIESLTGVPQTWFFTGAVVFLVIIFLLAILFGIKYC